MKRAAKWIGIPVGVLLGLLVVALGVVYGVTEARMRKTYTVQVDPVAIPTDAESIAMGGHLLTIRGCVDCHGENLGGKAFIDEAPMGRLFASNLTRGTGGVGSRYTDVDWVRAIRHGVGPDGRPLLFMPSYEYYPLSDEDLGMMIAYLRNAPPVDQPLPVSTVGPMGRALFLAGQFPLLPAEMIDHTAPRAPAPERGATVAYGEYLAVSCTGCHGPGFSGGKIPGTPPDFLPARNITLDAETGLGQWTEADFFRAMREGQRPDGTALNPTFMPWEMVTSKMTDDEIRAIWLYLQTIPAKPYGNR
jgi:mono/diheme cytochrome c family protein